MASRVFERVRTWASWGRIEKVLLAIGALGAVAAIVGVFFSVREDQTSVEERFFGRPVPAELLPAVSELVRQAHGGHARPGAARQVLLDRALADFAEQHHVKLANLREIAAGVLRRIDRADESLARGTVLAGDGNLEAAHREFASAAQVDPENAAAWSNLGGACTLLGKYDEARVAYDRALVLRPDDWQTRYNLGLLFARTGDPQEAMRQISTALASLRAGGGSAEELQAVLNELKNDPSLGNVQRVSGFRALVGG